MEGAFKHTQAAAILAIDIMLARQLLEFSVASPTDTHEGFAVFPSKLRVRIEKLEEDFRLVQGICEKQTSVISGRVVFWLYYMPRWAGKYQYPNPLTWARTFKELLGKLRCSDKHAVSPAELTALQSLLEYTVEDLMESAEAPFAMAG